MTDETPPPPPADPPAPLPPAAPEPPATVVTTAPALEPAAVVPVRTGPAPVLMAVLGLLAGVLIGLAIAYAAWHTS
jgi:hypothetical protein